MNQSKLPIIFDNIIFSLQRAGGASAYWFELCKRVIVDESFQCLFYEYKNAEHNICKQQLQIPKDILIKKENKPIILERYSDLHSKTGGVFHSSHYRDICSTAKTKEVTTVHDFTYEKLFSGLRKQVHIWQKTKAIAHSDIVICVSESTKKDLCTMYPQYQNKDIRVVYNGVSEDYYPLFPKTDSAIPYILWVGARNDYKNFDFAAKWVSSLKDYEFWIVGQPLSHEEQLLLDKMLPNRVKFIGSVTNEMLNQLYNNAVCFLYPSSYEGFGIPVIEAMRAGCPVITLNTSSLPEVCGDAGLMAEKLDTDNFTELLNDVVAHREQIVAKGLIQSAKFSWDKCYSETSAIYKELSND
ncbi:MAG: glycosyltransferase family 4 protein [Candidatus Symbiothrix sp.]|jgi:mannosyltransferase|nr:glycosyltransferase family 4 protein [Candidatus Symbiothrix sp.]